MSARPRPVTATFPPPAFAEHPRRSYSLSSGSSTASLVSVLDHDSCASLDEDSPDIDQEAAKAPSGDVYSLLVRQRHVTSKAKRNNAKHRRQCAKLDPVQQPSPKLQSQEQNDRHLSAWEQWILQKAKEERDAAEVKLRTQQDMETRAQEERPELEKKKAEMADKVQAWIDKYDAEMKRKRRLQRKREKAEQELKEEKKLEVLNKANEKFQEWLEMKNVEAAQRSIREKERKRQEQLDKEIKQQKNEAAYEAWCEKARNRPRTAPNSYGYCAGRLRGYYDANAYPAPSYYNPIPWHPIEIPEQKPSTKKKPVKIRVNRERYF